MTMRKEDNELLTRVGPGTAMGELLRRHWAPVIRAGALQPDGAPVKVRLFGEDFVAFRTTDGRAGIMEEACPHRGVSLALARNEDNGLRCIFHGWKFDVDGRLTDAPCEPADRRDRFCAGVKTRRIAVHEAAGVVWGYFGGDAPPRFPDFEFTALPPEQVCVRRAVVPYNWLQGLEAHIDSSHVAFLHRGFLAPERDDLEQASRDNLAMMAVDTAPTFEMRPQPYGLQESALRRIDGVRTYARIREVALPFVTFIPGPEEGPFGGRMSVPIDDETSTEWYVVYDPKKPLRPEDIRTTFHNTADDPDNFASNLPAADAGWGQDRRAMREGHFSGLTINLSFEDFVVQASMGRRVDRSREQLGSADVIIVRVRRMLLDAVRALQADGQAVPWRDGFDYRRIRARSVTYAAPATWQRFANDAVAPPVPGGEAALAR